ncbi:MULTISPECIES: uridine kinase family protein [unclassified Paenibacillus]|uniref:uridine kinase family protein n=1 Tax=unclassified Paenibacillus TaxID=185978 RepID=UPI00048D3CF2|nr:MULTISPECIES: AAA family ATPase [unclassified Paenibacillus]SDF67053.1 uridine kinase [Paenibacillus sp. cl6col]
MKPVIVGIAGGTGSGKSTFCKLLHDELSDCQVSVVSTDHFYKKVLPKMISPVSNVEYDDYNHPDALDYNKLMAYLHNILNSKKRPDVIIVEGIFTLYFEELRRLLDVKIFTELDADERMYRRISRNMKSWGMGLEEVATYYLDAAKHREQEFALPTKKFADIIINGNHLDGNLKHIISCWIRSNITKEHS